MHEFSICVHCRAAVDLKDTFRDKCPECNEPADWCDDPVALDERIAHKKAEFEDE